MLYQAKWLGCDLSPSNRLKKLSLRLNTRGGGTEEWKSFEGEEVLLGRLALWSDDLLLQWF